MRHAVSQESQQMQQAAGTGVAAVGLGFVLAPVMSGRFWDVAPESAPVVPYLLRILGAAQVGVGAATFLAGGEQRSTLLRTTASVGGLTAASAVLARARGRLSSRGAAMAVVTAGGLGGLAWAAAQQ